MPWGGVRLSEDTYERLSRTPYSSPDLGGPDPYQTPEPSFPTYSSPDAYMPEPWSAPEPAPFSAPPEYEGFNTGNPWEGGTWDAPLPAGPPGPSVVDFNRDYPLDTSQIDDQRGWGNFLRVMNPQFGSVRDIFRVGGDTAPDSSLASSLDDWLAGRPSVPNQGLQFDPWAGGDPMLEEGIGDPTRPVYTEDLFRRPDDVPDPNVYDEGGIPLRRDIHNGYWDSIGKFGRAAMVASQQPREALKPLAGWTEAAVTGENPFALDFGEAYQRGNELDTGVTDWLNEHDPTGMNLAGAAYQALTDPTSYAGGIGGVRGLLANVGGGIAGQLAAEHTDNPALILGAGLLGGVAGGVSPDVARAGVRGVKAVPGAIDAVTDAEARLGTKVLGREVQPEFGGGDFRPVAAGAENMPATTPETSGYMPDVSGGGPKPPVSDDGYPPAGPQPTRSRPVAPLRPIEDVMSEVRGIDNPVGRTLIGKSRINPSVLEDTPVGKAAIAYERQRIASENLTETSVDAALGKHTPRGGVRDAVGSRGSVFQVDKDGNLTNIHVRGGGDEIGTSRVWQDVFSRPDRYDLTPEQRAYVDDFHSVIESANQMRVEAGLKEFPRNPDGSLYVPRQVQNIRGVELRRPSSPKLQRLHDLAAEGVANGVRYDRDPANTLRLYLKAAYEEVLNKQLSDVLEPQSVAASDLVAQPIKQRMLAAIKQRQEAERAVRKERTMVMKSRETAAESLQNARTRLQDAERKVSTIRAELRGREQLATGQRQTPMSYGKRLREAQAEVAQSRKTLTDLRAASQDIPRIRESRGPAMNAASQSRLDAANANYLRAKNQYSRAMEAARKAEVAPGRLFGRTEQTIAVGQWRNRFYPREDYERLGEVVGTFGGVKRPEPNLAAKAFETVGNVTRTASAGFDPAMPFIQGLPVLARNPVAWAKMARQHYQAIFDPSTQARYTAANRDVIQEMNQYGVPTSRSAVEEYSGLAPAGKVLGAVEKAPGGEAATGAVRAVGKQTLGRFEAGYGTGLTAARAELWKSLRERPEWRDNLSGLAQYVRNMTGALDARALGVGPSQRGFESMWLAFSPRLLRSTVALAKDALNPTNANGREAARTLLQFAAGTTGLYVAAGLAAGKSWDEINDGLDPREGKKFLSYNVNGDWIGVGGQIRALTQLAANVGSNPNELAELSRDNPLIEFYSQRGAPALNIGGALVEGLTGGNTMPYDEIDGLPDILKHIGTSALPFTLQNIMEGMGIPGVTAGFLGARTSKETPYEERNQQSQKEYGRDYGQLTVAEKDAFDAKYPEVTQRIKDEPFDDEQKHRNTMADQRAAEQAEYDRRLKSGEFSRDQWVEAYRKLQTKIEGQYEERGPLDFESKDPVMRAYYAARDKAKDPVTGEIDWDAVEGYRAGLTAEQNKHIDERSGRTSSDTVREYRKDMKVVRDAGYWDLRDQGWAAFVKQAGYNQKYIEAGEGAFWAQARVDAKKAAEAFLDSQKGNWRVLDPDYAEALAEQKVAEIQRKFTAGITKAREQWREKHPQEADLLRKWSVAGTGKEERTKRHEEKMAGR